MSLDGVFVGIDGSSRFLPHKGSQSTLSECVHVMFCRVTRWIQALQAMHKFWDTSSLREKTLPNVVDLTWIPPLRSTKHRLRALGTTGPLSRGKPKQSSAQRRSNSLTARQTHSGQKELQQIGARVYGCTPATRVRSSRTLASISSSSSSVGGVSVADAAAEPVMLPTRNCGQRNPVGPWVVVVFLRLPWYPTSCIKCRRGIMS